MLYVLLLAILLAILFPDTMRGTIDFVTRLAGAFIIIIVVFLIAVVVFG